MRKPQAESGGSSTASQPQACPDAVGSAVNRRHFSAPQKLHADCEKEMLDGGVPGTTVRVSFDLSCLEMVRELWMWNVEEEHEVRICTWDAQHCGCPAKALPGPPPGGVSVPQSASQLMVKLLVWQKSVHKLWKLLKKNEND
nr:protein FAM182A-like isoform X9 [Pongo abelii]XP_054392486.1 protein FAM182A-like isoform X10 [Pongo abelii]